jgi:hypothetical protein
MFGIMCLLGCLSMAAAVVLSLYVGNEMDKKENKEED